MQTFLFKVIYTFLFFWLAVLSLVFSCYFVYFI